MEASQLTFLDLFMEKNIRTPGTDRGDKCAVTKPDRD